MNETRLHQRQTQRMFFPILLIALGLFWLLRNFDILPRVNAAALFRLWPVALIIVGLELIVGRTNRRIAAAIAVGGVAVLLLGAMVGPALGWGKVEVKTGTYQEALGNATAASVSIAPSVADLTVK